MVGMILSLVFIGLMIFGGYKTIKFFFKNFRAGRIISIIISAITLYVSLQPMGDGGRFGRLLALVSLSVAAWLFYRGAKKVFDFHYTGDTYYDVYYEGELNESEGGFFSHSIASAMVFTPLCAIDTFLFWGHNLKAGLYWLVPVILIVLNIESLIKGPEPEDDDLSIQ